VYSDEISYQDGKTNLVLKKEEIPSDVLVMVKKGTSTPLDRASRIELALQWGNSDKLDPETMFDEVGYPKASEIAEKLKAWWREQGKMPPANQEEFNFMQNQMQLEMMAQQMQQGPQQEEQQAQEQQMQQEQQAQMTEQEQMAKVQDMEQKDMEHQQKITHKEEEHAQKITQKQKEAELKLVTKAMEAKQKVQQGKEAQKNAIPKKGTQKQKKV
jgi:flagellar biosynthesis GTPase FlhF